MCVRQALIDSIGIKAEVLVALTFTNNIEIVIRERELNYQLIRELEEWAEEKSIYLNMRTIKKPFYISGHETYKVNEEEPYKILSFSKM